MEDTLLVSIPAHVGGATSYEWTATCSDSSDVKITPDVNDLSIIVTTSNPRYGSKLTINVRAKNDHAYSLARELTMTIEGAGDNYQLERTIIGHQLFSVITPPGRTILIDSSGLPLSHIIWDINNSFPISFQKALFQSHASSDAVSAILVPIATSNLCKSKIQ